MDEEERFLLSSEQNANHRTEQPAEASIGVAFSGGGIRSAAFASGVLRRLLHKEIPVDYVSCVSGGGFTGSAYLEWKYRHDGKDDPEWHEEFFNQMRHNANTLCTWRNPFKGVCDSLFIVGMIFTIGILVPLLLWVPMAFPAAYLVDYFFGKYMLASFSCRGKKFVQCSNSIKPLLQ